MAVEWPTSASVRIGGGSDRYDAAAGPIQNSDISGRRLFPGCAHTWGDQADFAPRMKKPVLMVNGRYDYVFSLDQAQNPLFR